MYAHLHLRLSKREVAEALLSCLRISFAALVLGLPICTKAQSPAPADILVGMRAENDDALAADRLSIAGSNVGHDRDLHDYRLRLRQGLSLRAALAILRNMPDVRYAEANGIGLTASPPNDYYWSNPLYANDSQSRPAQWGPQKIQAESAWGMWHPRKQVVIAIVDTGIDNAHPDLTDKIYRDGLGDSGIVQYSAFLHPYPDTARGGAHDDYGHGTHCAGIAAARINNDTNGSQKTIAGIAGWTGLAGSTDADYVKLMPVRVLAQDGSGSAQSIGDGI